MKLIAISVVMLMMTFSGVSASPAADYTCTRSGTNNSIDCDIQVLYGHQHVHFVNDYGSLPAGGGLPAILPAWWVQVSYQNGGQTTILDAQCIAPGDTWHWTVPILPQFASHIFITTSESEQCLLNDSTAPLIGFIFGAIDDPAYGGPWQ